MTENEAALERYFRHTVAALGGMTEKLAPTRAGVPDRLVLLPGGRIELVELKRVGGQLRSIQKVWHSRALVKCDVEVTVLAGRDEIDAWGIRRRDELEAER